MENKHQIELVLKNDLSSQELEITNRYWKVKDGIFNEKPSEITNDFELDTFNLSRIAKENGHLIITNLSSIKR